MKKLLLIGLGFILLIVGCKDAPTEHTHEDLLEIKEVAWLIRKTSSSTYDGTVIHWISGYEPTKIEVFYNLQNCA